MGTSVRIYLDACALNRLFDDRSQARVRAESDAIESFLALLLMRQVEWLAGDVLEAELLKNPKEAVRLESLEMLSYATERIFLDDAMVERAEALEGLGYGAFDALHLASAERARADFLLTTDDRFLRQARRGLGEPLVPVRNPVNWIKEFRP
jgi:predicted nucleic acid-binding protein